MTVQTREKTIARAVQTAGEPSYSKALQHVRAHIAAHPEASNAAVIAAVCLTLRLKRPQVAQ